MQNYPETLLAQFGNSPVLLAMIDSFNDAVDPADTIDTWYDMVWNIETAATFGLQVWGRIVGVTNVIDLPPSGTSPAFGYNEGGDPTVLTPYNNAPFYAGPPPAQATTVANYVFRNMIFAKAYANVTDRSIPTMNQGLQLLFPTRPNANVSDDGNMVATYNFYSELDDWEVAIIKQSSVVPSPTGVLMRIHDTTGYR